MMQWLKNPGAQKSMQVTKELWEICKFYPKVFRIHCLLISGIFIFLATIFWPKNASIESVLYFFVCDLNHSFDFSLIPMLFIALAKFHRDKLKSMNL